MTAGAMTAGAAAPTGSLPQPYRPLLFVLILAAHFAAIWLLLATSIATVSEDADRGLRTFDVAMPPPVVPPPAPTARDDDGGSAGVRRQRAAIATTRSTPPAPETPPATLLPATPPALPLPAAGTAPIALAAGGANGAGDGAGAGDGSGDGDGADRYARADWIKRAPLSVVRPLWPSSYRRLKQPVTVVLRCRVRRNGRPYSCSVVSETPRLGFGRAAMAYTAASLIRPVSRNGELLWDMPVSVPIVFHTEMMLADTTEEPGR